MSFLFKKNAAQDGVPTKFVGICYNGGEYFVTATSYEQAKRELIDKAKKNGDTIMAVRVAEDAAKDAAEFKVGDKVAVRSGGYGKIVAIKPNGMYKIEGGGMEGSFPASELVKAADSAAFKVGDKVKHKAAINGSVYKIIAVGRGFHGETIYKLSEHKYPYEWYKEHEIVAADSAAKV